MTAQTEPVQEAAFRLLFMNNPAPMWVYDLETLSFLEVNGAAVNQYGYSRSEFLAMRLTDIRPPEEVERLLASVRKPRPPLQSSERRHRHRNGRLIDVELTSHTLDFAGRPAALVVVHDVTARKQAEESLRTLNQELESRVAQRTAALERAMQELEAFSYSVSHDLRAPLRHVIGFATLLGDSAPSLDAGSRGHLSRIIGAATRMGTLIDDLLAFSRVGRTALTRTRVDLNAVVDDVRQELSAGAADRDIEWRVQRLPAVNADPSLLRLVLVNLLSNAVKYSAPRRTAHIEIGAIEDAGETVVFVGDDGVGFDARYTHKLFGVFERLHSSDEFEGTGIGLANVRRIIERHGGRTWAEGAIDRGARFFFSLPSTGGPSHDG